MSSVAMGGEGWEPPRDPLTPGYQGALLDRKEGQCWGEAGGQASLVWLRKSVLANWQYASEASSDSLRQRVLLNLYRKEKERKKEMVNISENSHRLPIAYPQQVYYHPCSSSSALPR